jgi:4-diphosphocytidyl-2-C-methyl-D-erythritol kinase
MKSITLDAPAKINMYLDVLGKRKDSYHNIATVFCKLSLSDKITVKVKQEGISVICFNNRPLSGRKNLAYKAAILMKKNFRIHSGIGIAIKKNIPIAAGLGGGSSDAASVIMAINTLFKINAPRAPLMAIARQLGADVGFFVSGYNFAIGRGIGDRLKEIDSASSAYVLLLVPCINIYTNTVYENLTLTLTKPHSNVNILAHILTCKDWTSKVADCLYNKLEDIVLPLYPVVSEGKQAMTCFTDKVLLSGSGPAIFGIFNTRKEAARAQAKLENSKKWRLFLTRSM